jgi:hypothetical protein
MVVLYNKAVVVYGIFKGKALFHRKQTSCSLELISKVHLEPRSLLMTKLVWH